MRKNIPRIIIFVSCLFLIMCQKEEVIIECLPEPCGTIQPDAFNVTLETDESGISDVVLHINAEQQMLSINNSGAYSCWQQTLPLTVSNSNRLTYMFDGTPQEVTLEAATLTSNAVVISIEGSTAQVYDYVECDP